VPSSDLGHRRNAASRLLPIPPHPRFALVDQDLKGYCPRHFDITVRFCSERPSSDMTALWILEEGHSISSGLKALTVVPGM
jgi:hypothetical protein